MTLCFRFSWVESDAALPSQKLKLWPVFQISVGLGWCCLAVPDTDAVTCFMGLGWCCFAVMEPATVACFMGLGWRCFAVMETDAVACFQIFMGLFCSHGSWCCGLFFRYLRVWGDAVLLSQKLMLWTVFQIFVGLFCCHRNWCCGLFFLIFMSLFCCHRNSCCSCFSDLCGSGVMLLCCHGNWYCGLFFRFSWV